MYNSGFKIGYPILYAQILQFLWYLDVRLKILNWNNCLVWCPKGKEILILWIRCWFFETKTWSFETKIWSLKTENWNWLFERKSWSGLMNQGFIIKFSIRFSFQRSKFRFKESNFRFKKSSFRFKELNFCFKNQLFVHRIKIKTQFKKILSFIPNNQIFDLND